jgi:tRNA G10  N-methylase Trm11
MNITQKIKPIHPFAARMAPEIAFKALDGLATGSIVLDPMAGSGTVLRTISELGYKGIGFDVDPLSVLMSTAWTTKIDETNFLKKADKILCDALNIKASNVILPWIDEDTETKKFIQFWFGPKQIADLRKLSYFINSNKGKYTPLFKIAFSKLIITKSSGASLAADISHSRPHKVRTTNDFEVFDAFKNVCLRISKIISSEKLIGDIQVKKGDARKLNLVKDESIDAIITSPPYLNALDYMRGHKMSLVWLGHQIGALSSIRGGSVGVEKAPDISSNIMLAKDITERIRGLNDLPQRKINMVYRYALDMNNILKESARVLKKKGNATFVIGNSSLQGVYIENTIIAEEAARQYGLKLTNSEEREIPQNKRYLPPPNNSNDSSFNLRMRTESVMTFKKSKR